MGPPILSPGAAGDPSLVGGAPLELSAEFQKYAASGNTLVEPVAFDAVALNWMVPDVASLKKICIGATIRDSETGGEVGTRHLPVTGSSSRAAASWSMWN